MSIIESKLSNVVRSRKITKMQMRFSYISAVTKVLEPVKDQIHQDLAQKLTATDSLLKDNIGKMVRSRVRLKYTIFILLKCFVYIQTGYLIKSRQKSTTNVFQER